MMDILDVKINGQADADILFKLNFTDQSKSYNVKLTNLSDNAFISKIQLITRLPTKAYSLEGIPDIMGPGDAIDAILTLYMAPILKFAKETKGESKDGRISFKYEISQEVII